MAPKANELEIIRVYDAPVKLVWECFTDVKHQAHWWGPRGFTITTKSKELRPGGKWIYTMHGPDGIDYPNIATYHEVVKYQKLVYDHGGNEERQKLFTVTVTFQEELGKTIMCMIMALDTPEAAKEIKKFIKLAGGNSTWDRLGEYLDHEQSGKEPFYINRTFEAPIAKIFEMWSRPEHLSKWLPPSGMEMKVIEGSIKSSHSLRFKMFNGDMALYGIMKFQEVSPVHRIVYTQQFTDENGNVERFPGLNDWPETLLTTVSLTEESENQTRVTVKTEAMGDITTAELQAFINERSGMTQGWTGSFDKLEELILE
jgi:uncharacterized protein YndB with AHSA1/START domain